MSLVLTIIKSHDQNPVTEVTKTFSQQGGSIGRGKDNTWVMPDPERYLSSRHSEISYENGQYFLIDISTNGTFINGSREPMGKGNRVQLKDGDQFTIGDYDIKVSLWSAAQPVLDDPFAVAPASAGPFSSPGPLDDDPFAPSDPFAMPSSLDSPFGGAIIGQAPGSEPLFTPEPEETDPLAALDKAGAGLPGNGLWDDNPFSTAKPESFATQSDQANALNQAVNWPNAIPDDWDDDLDLSPAGIEPSRPLSEPAARPVAPEPPPAQPVQPVSSPVDEAKLRALEIVNNQLQAELIVLKQQMASQPVVAATATGVQDKTLIKALGLLDRNLSDQDIAIISETIGELVRETISGLMQILSSRSSIKNEFRMNVTTIQPVENNPLKFSANVDDALENMFIKKGNAYKKPVEAVREGFEGIAEHQVAVLAGIRSAFKGVVERFDPQLLEQRFEKQSKGGIIPAIQKARNWDMYKEYYTELVGDLDSSFQYLYGDEFVQAYEDQLQKLAIARKSQK